MISVLDATFLGPLFFGTVGIGLCFVAKWAKIIVILFFPISLAALVFTFHYQFIIGGGEGGFISMAWGIGTFLLALILSVFMPED